MSLELFDTEYDDMLAALPDGAYVSTMTCKAHLEQAPDTLDVFLHSLTPSMCESRGMTSYPVIRRSSFSKVAFDIFPLPELCPRLQARVFTTTGSIVITGVTEHTLAFLCVDELERMFGIPISEPDIALVNVSVSLGAPLDIHHLASQIQDEATFVELPERYANRLIIGFDGVKVQVFGSGKITMHSTSYTHATEAWTKLFFLSPYGKNDTPNKKTVHPHPGPCNEATPRILVDE